MRGVREGNIDWGQRIALLLCIAFALIGLVPLSGGLVLRSGPAKTWAASETTRLLRQHLGLTAHFQVELSLIPLRLEILNLAVKDTKAAEPAITADLVAISPRFFSLLAGRIDVGDIELENSSIRLDVQQGKLQNVAFLLPESDPTSPALTRSPFRTLAITSAHLDLTIDGRRAELEGLDLDVVAEKDLSFDLALRAVGGQLSTTHHDPLESPPSQLAYDEDKLCSS
jgi:translocation and assembly module TamB